MNKFEMKIPFKGGILIAAIIGLGILTNPVAARELTVVSWGGPYQEAQRKFMFGPFTTETGTTLVDDFWEGGIGVLRTRVKGGNNNWDMVQVEAEELEIGCEEGLFEKIDFSRIGGKERFLPGTVHECGVGAVVYNVVITYDNDATGAKPANWADFFDTKKFPGKRGVRNGPKWNLEFALMADGVPQAQVYETLSTPEGVDRAFAAFDRIKDDLVYWKSGAQPAQMLAAGDVVMSTTFNSRVTAANEQDGANFAIIWDDSIFTMDSWVILKGTPLLDEAYSLLEFVTRAEPQAALPEINRAGPTNKDAPALIPEQFLHDLPTNPVNYEVALQDEPLFWIDNFDDLNERWSRWAGSN